MSKKDDKPKKERKLEAAREAPPPPQQGSGLLAMRKLVASLAGAELCYGDPVRAGEHVVIPVARVSAAGGGGFGDGSDPDGSGGRGGGGGGSVEAAPVGFISIGAEGARFEAIPDPQGKARALRTGATALGTLVGVAVSLAALRRRSGGGRLALNR